MRHFVDTTLEPALWIVADWSLRWAALIAVVALILWTFRPRRAAVRQLFLLIALIAGLLVPLTPRWGGWVHEQVAEPAAPPSFPHSAWERTPGRSAAHSVQEPDATQSVAPVRSYAERGNEGSPTLEPIGFRRALVLGLALCWCSVVTYLLMRTLCGYFVLRRLRRESVEAMEATADLFAACRAQLQVGNSVRLAIHPRVCSPILFGWLVPRVLVPPDWPQRSIEAQRAGFLHELAHVRRRDHLLAPLLEMVRIAFFFHPLVRWLVARLEHERELLCDEMVVRLGIDRRDYARLLLEFARSSGRLTWSAVSLPMSRRRTVKGRIHHLLEEDMERWIRPLPARWAIVLGSGILVVSLGVASFRVWAEEKEEPRIKQGEEKVAFPNNPGNKEAPDKSAQPAIKRENLRYGGKDFNQWRVEMLTELKGSIRSDGMKAFAAFGVNGYGPEATQAILEIMHGYDVTNDTSADDTPVVEAAYHAISKLGGAAVPALTQAVESKNHNERLFAIEALRRMRSEARSAVPVLLRAMKHDDAATRKQAMLAVLRIDQKAKGFVPALLDALKDKEEIRYHASYALRDAPIDEYVKQVVPALSEALKDKNSGVRLNAISIFNRIGPDKQAVGAVAQLLQDKAFNMRSEAYTFLRALGPDAKDAVPALIKVLKAPIDGFTSHAVDVLGSIGPGAKEAVPALYGVIQKENPELNGHIMNAIKAIDPNDKNSRNQLDHKP